VGADSWAGAAGAVSWDGADSWEGAAGADSWDGADSWEGAAGADSCDGADSCEGAGSGVAVPCGTCTGGWIDPEEELEDALELWPVLERDPVAPDALTVLPGKALAATSENTPVSATEPATNQRLVRLNLRRAASLAFVGLCGIASGDGEKPRSATRLRNGE
jgi:hypothetical protein